MKIHKKRFLLLLLGYIPSMMYAQTLLKEEDAIRAAFKNSPSWDAAQLKVKAQKKLQGTALNLANPDVTLESPTAEFMTVGVLQSFEFPTVYYRQGKLLKQQTHLTQKEMELTEIDVIQNIKSIYLQAQYASMLFEQLRKQDSIFQGLAKSMQRLFNAGQIDFIAKTYAGTQYGEVHTKFKQAEMDVRMAQYQLQLFTGIDDSLLVDPMQPFISMPSEEVMESDSLMVQQSIFNQYYEQTKLISWNEWKLEKNKTLPGFAFGYMNQGPKDSDLPLRLRGGITIPIWFWQYHASIKAAKIKVAFTEKQARAQQQNLQSKIHQAKMEVLKNQQALKYYSDEGLKESDAIISATQRMLDVGVSDYITYLRTLSEAYAIRLNAINAVKNYNQSMINLNYLTGKK